MTDKIVYGGKYLRVINRDGWEVAQRAIGSGAVCVVATTKKDEIILVEQYRKPVQRRVIELPAGLIGDTHREPATLAGQRELIEETGYDSDMFTMMYEAPSSSGMSDEMISMVRAANCTQVSHGGGVDGEDITVHVIRISNVMDWIRSLRLTKDAPYIDHKIYAALWMIECERNA